MGICVQRLGRSLTRNLYLAMNLLAVLVIAALSSSLKTESLKPIIRENIATALDPQGFISVDSGYLHTSIMLKIQSPLVNNDLCNTPCGVRETAYPILLAMEHCFVRGRISKGSKELERTPVPPSKDSDSKILQVCIDHCLRKNECVGFTAIKAIGTKDPYCILRAAAFSGFIDSAEAIAEVSLPCLVPDRASFCSENARSLDRAFFDKNTLTLERIWNRTTEALSLVNKASGRSNSTLRRKRGLAAVIPVVGLIASGWTLYQQYKLDKHVQQLSAKFNEFSELSEKFEKSTIEFEEHAVKVLSKMDEKINLMTEGIQCLARTTSEQILMSQRMAQFENYISAVFSQLQQGKLQGPVSTMLLNAYAFRNLANGTKFRNTVYRDHPELLTTGVLTLVDADKYRGYFTAHYILSVPRLTHATIYPLYRVVVVQFNTNNSLCGRAVLPPYVMEVDGDFLEAKNVDTCEDRGSLKLCIPKDKLVPEPVPCLAGDLAYFKRCMIKGEKCVSEFSELSSGLLVHAIGDVRAKKVGQKEIEEIPNRPYYPYKNYSLVIFDNNAINSIESNVEHVDLNLPSSGELDTFLALKASENLDLSEMVSNLNTQKEAFRETVFGKLGTLDRGFVDGSVIFSTICWIAAITYVIGLYVVPVVTRWYNVLKTAYNINREQELQHHMEMQPMPEPQMAMQRSPKVSKVDPPSYHSPARKRGTGYVNVPAAHIPSDEEN